MKPLKFSWILFGILLVVTAVLGSFSGVNRDNIPGFGASVAYGWRHHDVLLMVATLLSVALALWLLMAALTGGLSKKEPTQKAAE